MFVEVLAQAPHSESLTGYSLRSGQASFIQVTVTSAEVKDAAAARPFGLSAPEAAHGLAAAAQAE